MRVFKYLMKKPGWGFHTNGITHASEKLCITQRNIISMKEDILFSHCNEIICNQPF